jgi:uncharacterized protein (TIGR02391 family)
MGNIVSYFEKIVRKSNKFTQERTEPIGGLHPFDERNIHPIVATIAKKLFDDGHFAQSTFEVYKFIDKEIQLHSASTENGFKLMMQVFAVDSPLVKLNNLSSISEKDEQKGYQFLFAGSILAIRNPRGHEYNVIDSIDKCLDHLGLASLLIRRLEEAGFSISAP